MSTVGGTVTNAGSKRPSKSSSAPLPEVQPLRFPNGEYFSSPTTTSNDVRVCASSSMPLSASPNCCQLHTSQLPLSPHVKVMLTLETAAEGANNGIVTSFAIRVGELTVLIGDVGVPGSTPRRNDKRPKGWRYGITMFDTMGIHGASELGRGVMFLQQCSGRSHFGGRAAQASFDRIPLFSTKWNNCTHLETNSLTQVMLRSCATQ